MQRRQRVVTWNLVAAKCIDLYHSKELSEIVLKYKVLDDN